MKLSNNELTALEAESIDDFDEESFDEARRDIIEPLPTLKFEWISGWNDDEVSIYTENGTRHVIMPEVGHLWSKKIDQYYWSAMSRHETYHGNVAGHIWAETTFVYRDEGSFLVGQYIGDVFVASHFCPKSMRSGARMLKNLACSNHPVVLCPKQWMEDQLVRLGWMCVGHVPQWFDGDVEIKSVMINDGANRSSVLSQFQEYIGVLSE